MSLRCICLVAILLFSSLSLLVLSSGVSQFLFLARLPFIWQSLAAGSIISENRDGFDVTFRTYHNANTSINGGSDFPAVVPRRLHHILLGNSQPHVEWSMARDICMRLHPGWETFFWDDQQANGFVQHYFPGHWEMWRNYPHLVQKVDALRYMVLYIYGGAVLDLDLECKQSLEPLRRFDFVAPAAHPAGFSIGMMMARQHNTFVQDLIRNLPLFNRRWLLLPYATVMFSTGCHYASTIFSMQKDRRSLRILSGPPQNPSMHILNGRVDTPLFRHFGSSSWHGQDAALVRSFGQMGISIIMVMILIMSLVLSGIFIQRYRLMRKREGFFNWKIDEKSV